MKFYYFEQIHRILRNLVILFKISSQNDRNLKSLFVCRISTKIELKNKIIFDALFESYSFSRLEDLES